MRVRFPALCVECKRDLVKRSEWEAMTYAERKAVEDVKMVHKAKGKCLRCYDAQLRRARGIAKRATKNECVSCEDKLISRPSWYKLDAAERRQLRDRGFAPHGGRGLCQNCYMQEHVSLYPDMRIEPLESVPDDLVHPEHLKVRKLLRAVRDRRERVS